jgi:hypothetical protein
MVIMARWLINRLDLDPFQTKTIMAFQERPAFHGDLSFAPLDFSQPLALLTGRFFAGAALLASALFDFEWLGLRFA